MKNKPRQKKTSGPRLFSDKLAISFSISLLVLLCVGFSLSNGFDVFLDERAHIGYVTDVADSGFPDYKLGKIFETEKLNYLPHPSLYYLIVGTFARVLPGIDERTVRTLRSVNMVISALTLFFTYLGMRRLRLDPFSMLFGFSFMLSVPMFVIVSSSINNDPLSFLGCAIVTTSLLYSYDAKSNSTALSMFLVGIMIVSFTKATGALSALCLLSAFAIINSDHVRRFVFAVNRKWFSVAAASLAAIVVYYAIIHSIYGRFFPAAQGDPSVWFSKLTPDAPKWGLLENLSQFKNMLFYTSSRPYGHVIYPDLPIRVTIVEIMLILFPIFGTLPFLGKDRGQPAYRPFIAALFLGIFLFAIVYFSKIRALHLSTGYTGSIHARYFFGFLPAAAILFAIGFSFLRKPLLKALLMSLFVAGASLLFFPSYYDLFSRPMVKQVKGKTNYGDLTSDRVFLQSFIPSSGRISKIELALSTVHRKNTGVVILEVLDRKRNVIASSSVHAQNISDNSWVRFSFDAFDVTAGKHSILRLTSPDSYHSNAVRWLADEKTPSQTPFTGTPFGPPEETGHYFPDGAAVIDGKMFDADFAFKIYSD